MSDKVLWKLLFSLSLKISAGNCPFKANRYRSIYHITQREKKGLGRFWHDHILWALIGNIIQTLRATLFCVFTSQCRPQALTCLTSKCDEILIGIWLAQNLWDETAAIIFSADILAGGFTDHLKLLISRPWNTLTRTKDLYLLNWQ